MIKKHEIYNTYKYKPFPNIHINNKIIAIGAILKIIFVFIARIEKHLSYSIALS
jgi:hypothetical protein